MALTRIDSITALIIVDLQKGLAAAMPEFGAVVQRSRFLAEGFRSRGLPVVLVNVDGLAPGRTEQPNRLASELPAGFTDIVAELGQQQGDIAVTKRTWGAFASTDLEQRLKSLGVTQVVIAGVATGTGVESTARQAYEAGFNVTLAVDAMTDPRQAAHDHAISLVFPRLGETGTADAILSVLLGNT